MVIAAARLCGSPGSGLAPTGSEIPEQAGEQGQAYSYDASVHFSEGPGTGDDETALLVNSGVIQEVTEDIPRGTTSVIFGPFSVFGDHKICSPKNMALVVSPGTCLVA